MNCLDTSILFEIAHDREPFIAYSIQEFVIPDTTLAEFAIVMMKHHNAKTGDYWFNKLHSFSIAVTAKLMYRALQFRLSHRNKKISFFDAVGYLFSRDNGYTFITTDNDFRNLPGVKIIAK